MTMAVGGIKDPHKANDIISSGQADIALLARELIRDPYWPIHAAQALGIDIKQATSSQISFWLERM